MSKYVFSVHERWAIFQVHNQRCYLCLEPIDLRTMEVDHVIPESLQQQPEQLKEVIQAFGLDADFDLNSYENWLPACRRCNSQKRDKVFQAVPIILTQIEDALERADRCRDIASKAVKEKDVSKSLTVLHRAAAQDELSFEQLLPIVMALAQNNPLLLHHLTRATQNSGKDLIGFIQRFEFRITPDIRVEYVKGGVLVTKGDVGGSYDCEEALL